MNLVIQSGRLAADPETRITPSGLTTCSFRLAVQRPFKNANGERQVDFHNCVAWRNDAEFVGRYLKKGDFVEVKGTLQNRSYDAQDGSKRYVTEIICDHVEAPRSRSEAATAPNEAAPAQTDAQTGFEVAEDDDSELPF